MWESLEDAEDADQRERAAFKIPRSIYRKLRELLNLNKLEEETSCKEDERTSWKLRRSREEKDGEELMEVKKERSWSA